MLTYSAFRTTVLISLLMTLTGCGSYGYKTAIGENTYAPVDAHKVKLLFGPPPQPYEVIGVVTVDGGTWTTAGDMYKKLIKSAADLGADAVIVTGEGSYGTLVIPGVSTTTGSATTTGNAVATGNGNTVDAYGNATTTGAATTYTTPSYGADLPRDKGLAIKFTR